MDEGEAEVKNEEGEVRVDEGITSDDEVPASGNGREEEPALERQTMMSCSQSMEHQDSPIARSSCVLAAM